MSGDDFAGLGRKVLEALLGPVPTRVRYDEDRGRTVEAVPSRLPWQPKRWPEDLDGAVFLYRDLARQLAEGASPESIRRNLQAGVTRVAVLSSGGSLVEIAPARWRGEGSTMLFWHGREGRGSGPNLYVLTAAGPAHGTDTKSDAGDEAVSARAPQTARAESDCRRWLTEHMQKSPRQRPKPRGHFEREALECFSGLSARAFARAWDAAIADAGAGAWSASGRPRKTPPPGTPAPK